MHAAELNFNKAIPYMELSLIMTDQHDCNLQDGANEQMKNNCVDESSFKDENSMSLPQNRNHKKGKQSKQINLNFDKEGVMTTINVNHDKTNNIKGRKNRETGSRETGTLNSSQGISSRLRSHSGKLYTTSVSVENPGSLETNLNPVP